MSELDKAAAELDTWFRNAPLVGWEFLILARPLETKLNQQFFRNLDTLELSVRSAKRMGGMVYIGDLVQMTQADLLRIPGLGRKSLKEIEEVLAQIDLSLGMEILNWPPENIEKLAESYAEEY